MSVIDQIKRLHKQTLLKLKDIKRVVIADEAGVNNEKYLSRARTLDSYVNPTKEAGKTGQQEQDVVSEVPKEPVTEEETQTLAAGVTKKSATSTAAKKSAKTFKM